MKKIFLIVLFALAVAGCSNKELPPPNYPDFSTPQAAFDTAFYAVKYKDFPVTLDALTEEYQLNFGKNRAERLASLEEQGRKIPVKNNWHRIITKVEYNENDKAIAYVYFDDMMGKKIMMRGKYTYKNIDGKWLAIP